MQHLPPNTTLQGGKYRIERVLGQGGFGITYLAIQTGLERNVAIKEFFMKELCVRDESTSHVTLGTEGSREMVSRFREKFLKEARNIAKLNHPNIVRIIDVFEENGTAYYVMEYAEGGSLATKIDSEGYLSESIATRYILQVANALDYIHQKKMNHLDVKPANIMLNEKDEVVLIDFGLSKQYDGTTGKQTSTTPVGISEGYAPMEQYKQGGVGTFSPETDIYSLGATFFKMLTGITPPSASDINEDGVPIEALKTKGVSQTAIDVICKAMEGRKKDRLNKVRDFINALNGTMSILEKDETNITNKQLKEAKISGDETFVGEHVEKRELKDTIYIIGWIIQFVVFGGILLAMSSMLFYGLLTMDNIAMGYNILLCICLCLTLYSLYLLSVKKKKWTIPFICILDVFEIILLCAVSKRIAGYALLIGYHYRTYIYAQVCGLGMEMYRRGDIFVTLLMELFAIAHILLLIGVVSIRINGERLWKRLH